MPNDIAADLDDRWLQMALGLGLVALFVLRVWGLYQTPLNLGPDEAQYWRWAQEPAWGYYSKPPLIAWIIGGTTYFFSDAEWAVRLPAPLLHAATALIVLLLARDMFGLRTGVLAAVFYGLMPGVSLSSGVMTTDGVLLPLWALSLYALWRLRGRPTDWSIACLLGIAIGLAVLAKYAAVYFLLGMALAAWIDLDTRRALVSTRGAVAVLVALLITLPHFAWNAANDFQTLAHTADNANWGGTLFNPQNAIKFAVDQMGIVGPIGFVAMVAALFSVLKPNPAAAPHPAERWLICFIAPALIIILVQAVTSRAHANWAATAYVGGAILVTSWLVRPRRIAIWQWGLAGAVLLIAAFFIPDVSWEGRLLIGIGLAGTVIGMGWFAQWKRSGLLWGSYALHGFVAAVFMALAIGPPAWADGLGLAGAFKQTRGWPATTDELSSLIQATDADILVVDDRETWHSLDYYSREGFPVEIVSWRRQAVPHSFAERDPLQLSEDGVALIASIHTWLEPRMEQDFGTFVRYGTLSVPLGSGKWRRLNLFLAQSYKPVPRTPEWEAQFLESDAA
ncbi:MAG: glycosyltransferase family 39 protein, partial [Pseudomonadota bacterium]